MPDDVEYARVWLEYAKGDLRLAKSAIDGVPRAHLCYHAQQAAEKALKALLVCRGAEFPRTHDLERLRRRLDPSQDKPPEGLEEADALTGYATTSRYPTSPHSIHAIGEAELLEAVGLAESVVSWVESRLLDERSGGESAP